MSDSNAIKSLEGKTVHLSGLDFFVQKAFQLDGEKSIVGYWVEGGVHPEMPRIEHVLVPDEVELEIR